MKKLFIFLGGISIFTACKTQIAPGRVNEFPKYIDTETKVIFEQEKKTYVTTSGISVSNEFDGGKLNSFYQINDSVFVVNTIPENRPINSSPWYSFKIWSKAEKTVYIEFQSDGDKFRYKPKLSKNGESWQEVSSNFLIESENSATVKLQVGIDTLWVSAQELFTAKELNNWMKETVLKHPESKEFNYGKTIRGRDLKGIELFPKSKTNNEVIVLMSRQHPPEVTGQFAFLHFVDRLLIDDELTRAFKEKYQVLLFPMQNPDGVAMGHWRHNAGGVDLNRDWDRYNQPETKQMADYIANYKAANKSKVVLGIDFHSTWEDVYYTNLSDTASAYPNFTTTWLNEIKKAIPNYEPHVAPSNVGQPVSKGWFFIEHGAVGITYEIGDDTPRDFIKEKSSVAAEKMMTVLLGQE